MPYLPLNDKLMKQRPSNELQRLTSLRPSEIISRHRSGSTLADIMVCCLRDQAITRTNVDFSVQSSNTRLTAISQEELQTPINAIALKITYLRFYWNLIGPNDLNTGHHDNSPINGHPDDISYSWYVLHRSENMAMIHICSNEKDHLTDPSSCRITIPHPIWHCCRPHAHFNSESMWNKWHPLIIPASSRLFHSPLAQP